MMNYPPDFVSAVEQSNSMALRPLLQHPGDVVFREDDDLPLILVGDSLHAMPPYSGSGGNFALADAMELADFLETHNTREYPISELRELEKKMLQRTVSTMKEASGTRDLIVEANAKRLRGENAVHFFGPYYFRYLAPVLTWIYRAEVFLGLREDNGRS